MCWGNILKSSKVFCDLCTFFNLKKIMWMLKMPSSVDSIYLNNENTIFTRLICFWATESVFSPWIEAFYILGIFMLQLGMQSIKETPVMESSAEWGVITLRQLACPVAIIPRVSNTNLQIYRHLGVCIISHTTLTHLRKWPAFRFSE